MSENIHFIDSPIYKKIESNEKKIIKKYTPLDNNKIGSKYKTDLHSICEELKIELKGEVLENGILGSIKCNKDKYTVFYNSSDYETRQRFTIAHEIAHFLLHKDIIGNGIDDDMLYRSTIKKVSTMNEVDANKLGAKILMPLNIIDFCVKQERVASLSELADLLVVSEQALKIRLGIPN